jgi:hypothetical protein
LGKNPAQLHPVGPRSARRFTKDFFGPGPAQLLHLRVNALAVCRYPRIAVNHAGILHVIFAQEKPLKIKGPGFVHKS